jgi:hypothetical protein
MAVVNILACLDLEQNTLFLDRHYLSKLNNLITITFHLLGTEAFEKCFPPLAGFEFKENEDFNCRNTLSILSPAKAG